MTPRERLLAPFRGLKPDRPAWLADLSYWYGATKAAGKLDAQYDSAEGYKQLHEDLGVCCYYSQGGATYSVRYEGVQTDSREEHGERVTWWRTPAGELSDRWRYIPQAHCWAHVEYAVKTVDDLRVVADLFGRMRVEPNETAFPQAVEFLGDSGVPISAVPRSPLPALLADWCGVMKAIYLIADEPNAVGDTLEAIDRANGPAFDCAAASPVELFHFCDNLDSAASASLFEPYMGEYYSRRLQQLHAAGKFAVVHLDGSVRGLLPKLAAVGFDGVESITPAPVGDVAIEELRTVAANEQTILWGGIPGAMFCAPWGEDEVAAHARRLLDALAAEGRLVVGSADQIPPDGNVRLCRAIADACEQWRPPRA
ncbi:MAG: hypothetical protein COZ06_03705 [Armatimonadetes bacterium CG_4_10_14_3_um_filter_66_18]|nr:hypothetical protein [Armatimonadota bacterium]OIP05914.1 MAG: hypothetical protein AUJ96_09845 [Armatimonadetes bacterium CG2_30_66_41]PIU92563.1 MAG: hypothetical protein COS65_17405 [Armatimonadetes bacterium CG06_land_8_20_14_3_00_66_21]PIX44675.1 MAG: hypothetical protein COZ57_17050 [Armatimonadetes bacterium CG_4_8_14_3_um_filter_66_20]PIY51995.1 MAG: hypothetical protein COZ06_03705 [Armatimonadetes bacterium CG_4_10_14_3_um_filter_66_18]PIZ30326.1 MAG: hypothetical protein COY42_34